MSVFPTPPRGIKTRAQIRSELVANQKEGEIMKAKSDIQLNRKPFVLESGTVKSDTSAVRSPHKNDGSGIKSNSHGSSTAARQKQLEYEAAQAKAKIELEMQIKKARIEKELVDKKLAADLADLEENSRSSLYKFSKKSPAGSYRSKVEKWLDKSVTAPGSSLPCRKNHNVKPNSSCTEVEPRTTESAAYTSTHRAIEALTGALRSIVVTSNPQNGELLSRLATSKDLPLYFGDCMEWLQFRKAFEESTRLCNYSDTENLWRLRKCLRGEAKEATSSLLMSSTSPQEIMNTLELQFGRPENIMRIITSQLKKLQPLPHAYHTEIVKFSIKIKNYVTATRSIEQNDYLRSPELVSIVVSKLPSVLVSKWAEYFYQNQSSSEPMLELLSTFLYKEATIIATSGLSYAHAQTEYKRKIDGQKNQFQNQSVLVCTDMKNDISASNCSFCRNNTHELEDCARFKRALKRDRWRYVRTKKLCFKCLRDRHTDPSGCSADSCDVDSCGGAHHRLLHWVKPAPAAARQSQAAPAAPAVPKLQREPDDRDVVAHVASQCPQVSVLDNKSSVVPQMSYKVPKVLLKIVPITVHGPKQSVFTYALLDDGATISLIAADLADKAGLHGESVTMRANSAWDSSTLVCKTELLTFDVSNCDGNRYKLCARKLSELNLPIQSTSSIELSQYCNLFNHKYNISNIDMKPELLIGQDNYDLIAPILCKKYKPCGPYITKTLLGWCVHGALRYDCNNTSCLSTDISDNPSHPVEAYAVDISQVERCARAPHHTSADGDTLCYSACSNDINDSLHLPTAAASIPIDKNSAYLHDHDLHELVRRSFSLDSIGICSKPRQNIDELIAINILNDTAKLENGQWVVGLPWKSDIKNIPGSYPVALKRLKSVERKMNLDPEYESRYRERVQHLFENNYARELELSEYEITNPHIWYLPHFGVHNPNKKKLRLVFDAAAKSNGFSLNDFLLQGPDLLNSLFGIMFRFRENSIGIIGDIKDMFLRIKIQKEDQHGLRFLWREKDSELVKRYAMTSLIFGANCSPFVAQFINQNKNASRFQNTMPDAVHAIKNNQYMDDYIDSFSDPCLAKEIIKQISYIHQQGGFKMRNWLSNLPTVLSDVPKETINEKVTRIDIDKQPERALGVLWFPCSDMLAFDMSFKRVPEDILSFKKRPTKRELLRIVMSIFDIHGYLMPFTINGKLLMREIWKTNIQWDDELSDELNNLFQNWIRQSKHINKIRFPRWYFGKNGERSSTMSHEDSTLELHVFCDASPSAYAAVAYWRKEVSDGSVLVAFIASKSKITPSKPTTVPRLELQGAVLACRLADTIKREHRLVPSAVFYWTDSTTVLHWIKNQCRTYKTFIANRLGVIDELSSCHEWFYVPTNLNIADLGTKNTDYVLSSDSEWFSGPSFLHSSRSNWPKYPEKRENFSEEILEKVHNVYENNEHLPDLPVPDPCRFSSWLRLLRATATVLLYAEIFKKNPNKKINTELVSKAELLLIRYSQLQCFPKEINLLNSGKTIPNDSRLRTLTPMLDENGILRIDSRIGAVKDVETHTKYPIILDGKNVVTKLIVMHYHVNAAHASNEMVINELRQKYWLLKMRPTVRSTSRQCRMCRNRKALPEPPRLGNLPECRLTHHKRPFTMCGVDLFGPIEITVGRQRARRYGVLFTCLTVRAVHIELVASLTTDSMIMALRWMAARRGWPNTLFSDNGTNLRGADTELRKAYREVIANQDDLASAALNKGVQWNFIPPVSPHMGGAWERLIRSTKTALKVVLKERAPREETLFTFLCEVENTINSRPLTHVSVDPKDRESLTPNHFLIGSSSNLPQVGVFDEGDLHLRKQWRIAQRLADLFWSRWLKEVLPTLVTRRKWHGEGVQFKKGDVVVVVDPNSMRNCWPKGVVENVYPGPDGRVRVLDVKTRAGIIKRPATRVALLLSSDEYRHYDTKGQDVEVESGPPVN